VNHKFPYLWLTNIISGSPTKGREGGAVCSTNKKLGGQSLILLGKRAEASLSLGGRRKSGRQRQTSISQQQMPFACRSRVRLSLVFVVATPRTNIRIQIAKRDNVSRKRLRFSPQNSQNQMTWRTLSRRHSKYACGQATQKTILTEIFEFRSTGKNRLRSESKTAPMTVSPC